MCGSDGGRAVLTHQNIPTGYRLLPTARYAIFSSGFLSLSPSLVEKLGLDLISQKPPPSGYHSLSRAPSSSPPPLAFTSQSISLCPIVWCAPRPSYSGVKLHRAEESRGDLAGIESNSEIGARAPHDGNERARSSCKYILEGCID